jgi:nucleotide-binding universal stress UspA family protein
MMDAPGASRPETVSFASGEHRRRFASSPHLPHPRGPSPGVKRRHQRGTAHPIAAREDEPPERQVGRSLRRSLLFRSHRRAGARHTRHKLLPLVKEPDCPDSNARAASDEMSTAYDRTGETSPSESETVAAGHEPLPAAESADRAGSDPCERDEREAPPEDRRPMARRLLIPILDMARMLFATDFSPDSAHALELAKDIAAQLCSELIVLHVDENVDAAPLSREAKERREAARRELARTCEELERVRIPACSLLRTGDPAREIVRVASERGVLMIVVATHGSTRSKNLLLGSVVDRVLRHATMPVLAVRHPERFAPAFGGSFALPAETRMRPLKDGPGRPRTQAGERGSATQNVVCSPGELSTPMVPPISSTASLQNGSPRPVSLTGSLVGKRGTLRNFSKT